MMFKGSLQPKLSYDSMKNFKLCPVWWDSHTAGALAQRSSNMKQESYTVGIPGSGTSNTTYYGGNLLARVIQFK